MSKFVISNAVQTVSVPVKYVQLVSIIGSCLRFLNMFVFSKRTFKNFLCFKYCWRDCYLKGSLSLNLLSFFNTGNRSQRFNTAAKTCHWIQPWTSSIHFPVSQPTFLRSNLMLSSHSLCSKWSIFWRISHLNSVSIPYLPTLVACPAHRSPPDMAIQTIPDDVYRPQTSSGSAN